jgi:pyruvate formate lyase activating enzyme
MEAAAQFVSSLTKVRQVDLLPYHRIGEPKFARMGITYTLAGLQAPTQQRLESLAAIFRARGLVTTIGGRP